MLRVRVMCLKPYRNRINIQRNLTLSHIDMLSKAHDDAEDTKASTLFRERNIYNQRFTFVTSNANTYLDCVSKHSL